MKLWKAYCKELKIASRGFYFYIELIIAVLVLMVLMMVVKPWPDGHQDEYLFNDMPKETMEWFIDRDLKGGRIRETEKRNSNSSPVLSRCETVRPEKRSITSSRKRKPSRCPPTRKSIPAQDGSTASFTSCRMKSPCCVWQIRPERLVRPFPLTSRAM